jgi:hypothetical protein
MILIVHPGSRITDPDADFLPSRIQDPGSRGQKGTFPGSRIRIRNTGKNMGTLMKTVNLQFSFNYF